MLTAAVHLPHLTDDELANICASLVMPAAHKTMAARTLADYDDAIGSAEAPGPLRAFFGDMLPDQLAPEHISQYLEIGATAGRGTRANRKRACPSSCMSWIVGLPTQ